MTIKAQLPGGHGCGYFVIDDEDATIIKALSFEPDVFMSSNICEWMSEQEIEDEDVLRQNLCTFYGIGAVPDFQLIEAGEKGLYKLFPVSHRAVAEGIRPR
jgi:hypothetical protein